MKKSILLINCLCLFAQFYTNAQENIFSKVIYPNVQANSVVSTFDNSYIIGGLSNDYNNMIMKVDSSGNLIWNKILETNKFWTSLIQILVTSDSAFIVAGDGNQDPNAICIKINNAGDILWIKGYVPKNLYSSLAYSLQATIDSGFVLSGYSGPGAFLTKLDINGDMVWAKQFAGGNQENYAYSAKQTPDSGYIVTGFMENYPPFDGFNFLIKLDSDGSVSWSKKYKINNVQVNAGFDIEVLSDGYLCLLNEGLIKTDFAGNVLWCKKFNHSYDFIVNQLHHPKFHKTADDAYVFVQGDEFNLSELIKIDTAGNLIWSKYLDLIATDVTISGDKGYFIVGNGPIYGEIAEEIREPHIGIIKTDSLFNGIGCIWGDGYFQLEEGTVTSDTLVLTIFNGGSQNSPDVLIDSLNLNTIDGCISYLGVNENVETSNIINISPNPNNGVFQVTANTILTGNTGFEVLDITGKVLFNCHLYEGTTTSNIDCSGLANGLYFYRILENNSLTKAGKIVISK
jgi:hypothetical protein